jgi:hypothetical protein
MPIQRTFLDWSRSALAAAVEYLLSRYQTEQRLDLSKLIVVVPGGRAGRRLIEILVERADEASLLLTPPQIATEGRLPELLYTPQHPFADELTQQLAWAEALRNMPTERRSSLVPHPPASNDFERWLELGDLLRRLHVELAADGLDFGQVLKQGPRVAGFAEQARWETLCAVQHAYLARLDELKLWDVQTARLVAIRQREIATDCEVILLGAVDLNRSLRQMLDQISDRVTALVYAPQSLASRFDEHGCLRCDAWLEAEVPLAEEQIERVDGPAEQADAVVRWLASLNGQYRADEVVVGLPDPLLAPQVMRQLAQHEIHGRWVEACRLAETAPYRLLSALAEYYERQRFADLANLVRHPDVESWLNQQTAGAGGGPRDWLTALDTYHGACLPLRLDATFLAREAKQERKPIAKPILELKDFISRLLPREPLTQPLSQWVESIREALVYVYGEKIVVRENLAERYLEQTLRKITAAIDRLERIPKPLEPSVTFSQAVKLALAPLVAETLPPPADANAIELLGWLELPLDDSPALVVTSFNEGIVPQSKIADPFLPNELRRQLALEDNDRRYARDAYALSVLAASRQSLKLIVGHRDAEGNPLAASRLLFAADDARVAQRAVRLFGSPPSAIKRRVLAAGLPPAPKVSALSPPPPLPLREPLDHMSVTHFRTYLACPYRYYLRHVLHLEAVADDGEELDGGQFGVLVHEVLEHFGRDAKMRGCDEAETIYEFLDDRLAAVAAAKYGTQHGRPAIRMQVEQIRRRLRTFADLQAARIAEGWQILHSEDADQRLQVDFPVDGQGMTLLGRIDRIDWQESSGTLLVLDYKTSDGGDSPERAHRKRDGQWIDLQLPLYRHLLSRLPLNGKAASAASVRLGYFTLPKDMSSASVQVAEWSADDLAAADDSAREVIRNIRRELFWPPKEPPPAFCDDLAPICHDHRLGTWREMVEEGA